MTYAEYHGTGRFGAATPGARPEPPPAPPVPPYAPGTGRPDTGHQGTCRRITRPRLAWAGVAVAIAAGGYAAGYFTAPGPQATKFLLVTSVPLPAGARIAAADLAAVEVAAGDKAPAGALSQAAAASITGLVTATALPRGTFLSQSLLTDKGAVPGPAQALVGLALKPGQVPAGGLADGQRVLVVALPAAADGTPLTPVPLAATTVWDEQGADSSGTVQATVVVPASIAVQVAQYAAQGQIALVQTAAGGAS